jgi:hypothetical protein
VRVSGQRGSRDSGQCSYRDRAGVGTPGHGSSGQLGAPGVGTVLVSGVGSRDSPPAAKAQEGRGKKWVVFQKKVCHGRTLNTGGGGLPNPTESTMWGMQLSGRSWETPGPARSVSGKRGQRLPWDWSWESWNGEMDEGIEGRSGVTLAGSNSVEREFGTIPELCSTRSPARVTP